MLSIGEFSKICQVSVKTLHHYDKLGLLVPAQVDAETGYRYYEAAQLDRMLLIARLKRYGFSLAEIRSFLDADDDAEQLTRLRQQETILQRRAQEQARILRELSAHLVNFERTGDIMDHLKQYEVSIVTAPLIRACMSRQVMSIDEFGYYYSGIFERITRDHLTPTHHVGAVYYDQVFDPAGSDIALFVGIEEADQAEGTIGGQRCAHVLHKGAYSTLPDAYAAIVRWFEENGYAWDGAPFEIYVKDQFNSRSPEEWETEIYFPIREND